MSQDGQTVVDRAAGLAVELRPREGFALHVHARHQIALAARGVLVMSTECESWVLPRNRALWVPAGVPHSVVAAGETTMLSAYIDPSNCPVTSADPLMLVGSGLLGELVTHLARADLSPDERRRAEALMWDVMIPLSVTTLSPPLPVDERAKRVAEGLLADVTDRRSLAAWGRTVGASGRTLARRFVSETGLGFERWRSTARLAAALPLLASGTSVATTAYQVGYGSPSAFVAAFRREVGTTPATYFRGAELTIERDPDDRRTAHPRMS